MNQWDFMTCQLAIGVQSRATPEAQAIAENIVSNHLLNGYTITPSVTHLAVEQTAVDDEEEFE